HEGVARIEAHRFDTLDQLVIDHARGTVFQLSHALVDQRDEIGETIGNRRVAGIAGRLGIAALEHRPVAGAKILRVVALRLRDQLGEHRDLFVEAGTAAEEDVDRLLEIEQPERQLQVARVEHQRAVAEAARIFVVAVEQKDSQVRPRVEDLAQDQRDAARFADARRAQYGEMLAQHFVYIDVGADRYVLLQLSDVDRVGARNVVDQPQLVARDQRGRIADRRIVGDAALEIVLAVVALADFAHHVEARGGTETLFVRGRRDVLRDFRHHSDQQRFRALDAQELADRYGC